MMVVIVTAMVIMAAALLVPSQSARAAYCPWNSTQATCECPTSGPGVTCISPQLYSSSSASCYNDPRSCPSSNQRLNCDTGACVCDTPNYPCSGCTASQTTIGDTCASGSSTDADPECAENSKYTGNCGSWACPSGTTLCSTPKAGYPGGYCVTNRVCPTGMTWDVCADTCSTPYILLNPPSAVRPQTGADAAISGSFALTSGDLTIGNGDVYVANGKAVRVDGAGVTTLNFGNWGTGATGFSLDVQGILVADGLRLPAGAGAGLALVSDASGNASWQPLGGIGGGGTPNYVAKFTAASTLGDSSIFDDGTNVGVGTAAPAAPLHVASADSVNPGLRVGDGATGRAQVGLSGWYDDGSYFSPFGRNLYVRGATSSTLFYSANTYLGNNSGTSNIQVRDNKLYGSDWYINYSGPNGRWGVGTVMPTYKLDVVNAAGLALHADGMSRFDGTTLTLANDWIYLGDDAADRVEIRAQNVGAPNDIDVGDSLYIDSSASRVGIGSGFAPAGLPTATLDVGGNAYILQGLTVDQTAIGGDLLHVQQNHTDKFVVDWDGDTTVAGLITANGGLRIPTGAAAGLALVSDASGNASWQPLGGIGGGGTPNYVAKFTAASTLGDSVIYDNGASVGIGTTAPEATLDIYRATAGDALLISSPPGTGNKNAIAWTDSAASGVISARIANVDDGNYGAHIVFENRTGIGTTTTERMRIATTGNVGIGNAAPAFSLDITGDLGFTGNLYQSDDTNTYTAFSADQVNYFAGGIRFLRTLEAVDDLLLLGNAAADMDIQMMASGIDYALLVEGSSGRVGIGTGVPGFKLDVQSDNSTSLPIVSVTDFDATMDWTGIRLARGAAPTEKWFVGMNAADDKLRIRRDGAADDVVVDSAGNVGIGTDSPAAKMQVIGGIRASTYIATNGLGEAFAGAGGVNSNFLHSNMNDSWFPYPVNSYNYIRGNTYIGNDTGIITTAGNMGLGMTAPAYRLDVNGTINTTAFRMPTGAAAGLALVSDASGVGTWQPLGGIGGGGTPNYVAKFTAASTLGDSIIFDDGVNVGIGNAAPAYKLHVTGTGRFTSTLLVSGTMTAGGALTVNGNTTIGNASTDTLTVNASTALTDNGLSVGAAAWPSTLVVTNTGLVGIGTAAPTQRLEVNGAVVLSTIYMAGGSAGQVMTKAADGSTDWQSIPNDNYWTKNGLNQIYYNIANVGIGSSSPGYRLDVRSDNSTSLPIVSVTDFDATMDWTGLRLARGAAPTERWFVGMGNADDVLRFRRNGATDDMVINTSGNVGIGSTNPTSKLYVSTADSTGLTVFNNSASRAVNISNSGSGEAIYATSYGGVGARIFGNSSLALFVSSEFPSNNVVEEVFRIQRQAGGVGANGIGAAIGFSLESNAASSVGAGKIAAILTEAVLGSEDSVLAFYTVNNAVEAERVRITNLGRVGIGTTSPSYPLDVNGNANATQLCIAGDCRAAWPGAGAIGGSGTQYGTAVWSNASTLTSVGPGSAGQLYVSQGAANPAFVSMSGDATIDGAGVVIVANNSHTHTTTTISGLDASNDFTAGVLPIAYGGTNASSFTASQFLWYNGASIVASGYSDASFALASHNHSAANITSGTLAVARGGTGNSSYAVGDILYASAATTLSRLAIGADGLVLKISGGIPSWKPDDTGSGVGGSGTANYVAKFTAGTTLGNSTIFDNGNVGIGTAAPGFKLDVTTGARIGEAEIGTWPADGAYAYFGHEDLDHSVSGNYALVQAYTGTTYLNAASGRSMYFRIGNSSTPMFISSGGLVGMGGNVAPAYDLDVTGTARFSSGIGTGGLAPVTTYGIYAQGSSGGGYFNDTDGTYARIAYGDWGIYTAGDAYLAGNTGIGTTVPDYKLDVNGNAGFNDYIYHNGDTDTYTYFTTDYWRVTAGGTNLLTADYGAPNTVTVGTSGVDTDLDIYGPTRISHESGQLNPDGHVFSIRDHYYFESAWWWQTWFSIGGDGKMFVNADAQVAGFTGLGTAPSSSYRLFVANTSTTARFDRNSGAGYVEYFYNDGTYSGGIYVSGTTTTYYTFTGAHYAWTEDAPEDGMLVVLNGRNRIPKSGGQTDPVYGIDVSTRENDPLVMGSYFYATDIPEGADVGHDSVASVGNGDMWVVDGGEDVEAGDYLISSSTVGHAVKDTGKHDESYIIARATEDIDWDSITDRAADGRRHKKISVFFENFVKDNAAPRLASAVAGLESRLGELTGGFERLKLDVTGRIDLIDAKVGELQKANDELKAKTEELEGRVKQLEWQMLSR